MTTLILPKEGLAGLTRYFATSPAPPEQGTRAPQGDRIEQSCFVVPTPSNHDGQR